uniref:ATP synthase subunit a n=1 Tax=Nilaparvata lugens TaxID=108931 RepID=A0A075B8X3_NILLU|nr:ATP synthase F0 subunit 6 [Nilaparvata lugens]AGE94073.1 ATP synthase F0 subunit 6 [Nilaparvata lugens]
MFWKKMMSNLFSSFDPSTPSPLWTNWISLMLILLFMPNKFWISESRNSMTKLILKNFILKEMSFIYFNKQFMLNLQTIFIFILTINLMGISPYTFTPTSHLSVSIAIGLPIWISLMTYSWLNFTNLMFSHLLPMSTPPTMAPFMIMVESISNLIRPISLSVRLSANMIAGHLLMTLLGNINEMKTIMLIGLMQFFLMLFEISVALIQAYVFSILMTM